MAFNLDSITRGVRQRPPRIVMLGTAKIGKSEWAAGAPNPIFIPIRREEGIDDIDVPQCPVCNTVNDVRAALHWLHATPDHGFTTVVLDSSSTLEALIWDEVCLKHNANSIGEVLDGYGKGEQKALLIWQEIADLIDLLRSDRGMASIVIGHVIVARFDDPEGPSYDRYHWNINKHASAFLTCWADSILFANKKTIVKEQKLGFHKDNVARTAIDPTAGRRFLYTQDRPAHPGGGRGVYGRLPYELDLSWDAFVSAVANAPAVRH